MSMMSNFDEVAGEKLSLPLQCLRDSDGCGESCAFPGCKLPIEEAVMVASEVSIHAVGTSCWLIASLSEKHIVRLDVLRKHEFTDG